MESPRYALNRADLKKVGIGALVAVSGALLTYLSQAVSNIDFGVWTPMVMAAWSVIANVARKFIAGA